MKRETLGYLLCLIGFIGIILIMNSAVKTNCHEFVFLAFVDGIFISAAHVYRMTGKNVFFLKAE